MKKFYFLFLLTLLPLMTSAAGQVEIDGIWYVLDSISDTKTASVASNPSGKYSGSIDIPESVTYGEVTYSVTSIGDDAFYYCPGLISVTIPNSVTSIGRWAFCVCGSLTSITIPNSVTTIGNAAFCGCSGLTSITIPNSVTSIGIQAFQSCSGLTSVTIPNSVTSIGSNAFDYCSGLTSIIVDANNLKYDSRDNCNAIIEKRTTELIWGCKNTVIPNSVTSIGHTAFSKCTGLTSITIPSSVTSIDGGAFFGCSSLTSINVDANNPKYDSRDNCNALIETATNTLIAGCKNTVIPNGVTSIFILAFYGCSGLISIEIPNSVTSIGSLAFSNCSSLTSIEIPNNVTSLGSGAFEDCSGLTSVVVKRETPVDITSDVFTNRANATLYVPQGCIAAYKAADYWKEFKEIKEIQEVLTLKGEGTFDNPYLIGTAEELKEFNDMLASNDGLCAKLIADIVLNANVLDANYNLNGDGSQFEQWTPHGNDKGYFNGAGHTISGLYINNSKEYQALFESASRIDSLGVVDSYIKAYRHAGGLCSWLRNGTNTGGKISSCYFDGVVIATEDKAGGISAHMGNGYEGGLANSIENCYNKGHINGKNHVGGICGSAYSLTSSNSDFIENCYNIGIVSAEWTDCGDICGYADNAQGTKVSAAARKCYSLSGACTKKGEGYTGIIKSLNEFNDGSVCSLLNNGGGQFHQSVGVDDYPILWRKTNDNTNDNIGTVADVVDLGLSVKWASWNVGADKPEGLGNLYAWGELEPKTDYSTSTYKFYSNGYTKYGSVDNKYQLDSEDDVAKQKWGDKWRIPTIEELKELKEKCTFTKTELNGVPVTKVTGPNGNFIYFPYPGNFTGTTLYFENSIGSYWSSDLESDSYAKDLDFLGGMPDLNGDSRYHGQSIRPVYAEATTSKDDFGTVADVVDLGLSVKWASWNVGADKPEGLGNLYAWGELEPKTDYSTSTYKFYSNGYTKYGSVDNKYQLDSEDDVAKQKWGDKWRIPTIEELKELKEKCTFTKTELNGVPVTKVTGPNGNFIYFPYPGNFTGTTLYFENSIGSYWSSDLESDSYAKDLDFLGGMPDLNGDSRYHGQSIRPVYAEATTSKDDFGTVADVVDLGLSVKWASWNVGASKIADYGGLYGAGDPTGERTNYSIEGYHRVPGECISGSEYDLATVKWGEGWRMPTIDELKELREKCTWESNVIIDGVKGVRGTGPNGNQIFIPCAGTRQGSVNVDKDRVASIWSGNVGSDYPDGYEDLDLYFSGTISINGNRCYIGQSIRPVYVQTITPVDENDGVDYGNGDINEDTGLNSNVIGNIYYNIGDDKGEYSSTEGCITLRKATSDSDMNDLVGKDIFGEDFKKGFTGIVFMVQAGQGTIKVNAESVGNMTLKVKIGSNAPMTFELEGKMKASIPYSVTKPTYVYIYGGETSTANAGGLRAASSDNALKIYGIEWSDEVTSIKSINRDVETKDVIYNLNGQRMRTPTKGINIINGKKVMVK